MKRLAQKTKGLIKGAPTAVLVSAGIHLVILFAAGSLVVFHVIKKQEKKFEPPPPVERKKMDLKKPKVKVKKQARPKSTQRITTKAVQSVSDFQLPETSSVGEGLGGGVGGFEMVPDVANMSIYGSKNSVSVGNDFEGTFYILGIDRKGNETGINGWHTYATTLRRFYDSGWNPNALARFYRSPQNLYTTFFFIPMSASETVPRRFGIPEELNSYSWAAHYKGQFAAKETGEYRFWARAENHCALRVNGETVLLGGHANLEDVASSWHSTAEEHRTYWRGHGTMGVGDWVYLEAGKPADFEIVFGDTDGGAWTQCTVTIQKKGEFYPKNPDGAPILPVFKTAEIPQHLIDQITYSLIGKNGDAADLESPVMFNVY